MLPKMANNRNSVKDWCISLRAERIKLFNYSLSENFVHENWYNVVLFDGALVPFVWSFSTFVWSLSTFVCSLSTFLSDSSILFANFATSCTPSAIFLPQHRQHYPPCLTKLSQQIECISSVFQLFDTWRQLFSARSVLSLI